jgi:hypothetical protein
MAKNRSRDDESLLLRSAESLGRMIGSLQRQLDIATGRLAGSKPDRPGRKRAAAKSGVKARSGATKTRGGARKKSAARKRAKKR